MKFLHVSGNLIPHDMETRAEMGKLAHQDTLELFTLPQAREMLGVHDKGITDPQRNAYHKWLRLVAEEMNSQGITLDMILEKKTLDVDSTMEALKETVWKPAVQALFQVDSSEKLEPKQVNDVYIVCDRFFSKHWNISIPFPDWRQLAE